MKEREKKIAQKQLEKEREKQRQLEAKQAEKNMQKQKVFHVTVLYCSYLEVINFNYVCVYLSLNLDSGIIVFVGWRRRGGYR